MLAPSAPLSEDTKRGDKHREDAVAPQNQLLETSTLSEEHSAEIRRKPPKRSTFALRNEQTTCFAFHFGHAGNWVLDPVSGIFLGLLQRKQQPPSTIYRLP